MKYLVRPVILVALLCCATTYAQTPDLVHYQGRLLEGSGAPMQGMVDMTVRLYNQATGGAALWQQVIANVPVADGVYQFYFGDAQFAEALTNTECWLELAANNEVLGPRERQIAVPYALRSAVAQSLTGEYIAVPAGLISMWSGSIASIPSGWVLCDGSNGTPDMRSRFVAGAADSNDLGAVVGASSITLSSNQLPSHTHSGVLVSGGAHAHSGSTASAGSHTHGGGGIHDAGWHGHSLTYGGYGNARGRPGGQYNSYPRFTAWLDWSGDHGHAYYIGANGNHTHSVTVNSAGDHTHSVSLAATGGAAAIDNRPAFYTLAFIMKAP